MKKFFVNNLGYFLFPENNKLWTSTYLNTIDIQNLSEYNPCSSLSTDYY